MNSIPLLIKSLRRTNKYVKATLENPLSDLCVNLKSYQAMTEQTLDMELVDKGEFPFEPCFVFNLQIWLLQNSSVFLWQNKKENSTLQINNNIDMLTIKTITRFYFTNYYFSCVKLPFPFRCGSPFFIWFLLPPTSLAPSGHANSFHQSLTSEVSLLTESLGLVTGKGKSKPAGFFSLECPPGVRQMLRLPLWPRVQRQTICSGSIKSRSEKFLLWDACTSWSKRVR